MPLYVIEHEVPAVGDLTKEQARKATLDLLDVFEELGQRIEWVESYVVEDKAYCIYAAADKRSIRRQARKLGIPVSRIAEVRRMMKPADAT
ncbi:MAG TPA: nickel-binding protein [Rhodanobacteraceae bacterium]|jgi:hypothetical protein|nr:nickel-binding protein [Rhodanobacteraceae bacterium]